MMISNSKGKIWYGLHFYPGVAQYQEEGQEPFRVYLNEDTLRKMDPSFAGRPIFVEHVDEVDSNLSKLRTESEGWVVESFFNSSDGRHWVKFITVTDSSERAIRSGYKLSNAYIPKSFKPGGLWNGVPYAKEIVDGEYEHLALVKNPRYEESIILTPEEFKKYNEDKIIELKKLSNNQASDWKESDHPRSEDGQFGSGGSGGSGSLETQGTQSKKKDEPTASKKSLGTTSSGKNISKFHITPDDTKSWTTKDHQEAIGIIREARSKLKTSSDSWKELGDVLSYHGRQLDRKKSETKKNSEEIKKMKFNLFKKTKVENEIDTDIQVVLPKSGKTISLGKLINDAYEKDEDSAMGNKSESSESSMANVDHMVKMHDSSYMKVKDMMNKYKAMNDELEDLKKKKKDSKEEELDLKSKPSEVDAEGDLHNKDEKEESDKKEKKEDSLEHPEEVVHDDGEDQDAKKKALELAEHEQKEVEEEKKKNIKKNSEAKAKADRLRNAHITALQTSEEPQTIDLSYDRVARGKTRYGS